MKLFVAGATGVLGRRVVGLLVEAGHHVVGLSRSAANDERLGELGAEARRGDLFDRGQVADLSADCDGVLHLATAIPTASRPTSADWALNDRIRREGTRNLVAAAVQHHCVFYLQQSITFVYGDRGGDWVDESSPLPDTQPDHLQSAVDMEEIVNEAVRQHDLPAVILRYGSFYSHDAAHTRGMLALLAQRRLPLLGNGRFYWNLIHADDAAAAVLRAVEAHPNGLGQTFNICDDEPVLYRDMVEYMAERLGAARPRRVPLFLVRLLYGRDYVAWLTASARCRNDRAKEMLGWRPRFPTYREGYAAVVEAWRGWTPRP